jgi:hypothetical protein
VVHPSSTSTNQIVEANHDHQPAVTTVWSDFWDWLAKLPPGSATFVGTLTGSSLGLVAILLGALFNARLNRRRDDVIREGDRIALASALYAELSSIHQTFIGNAESFASRPVSPGHAFVVPQPSVKVFPEVVSRLGLLKPDTIHAVITAYLLTEQYLDGLILLGGNLLVNMPKDRQLVQLGAEHADIVRQMNEIKAGPVKVAMQALAPYLK